MQIHVTQGHSEIVFHAQRTMRGPGLGFRGVEEVLQQVELQFPKLVFRVAGRAQKNPPPQVFFCKDILID